MPEFRGIRLPWQHGGALRVTEDPAVSRKRPDRSRHPATAEPVTDGPPRPLAVAGRARRSARWPAALGLAMVAVLAAGAAWWWAGGPLPGQAPAPEPVASAQPAASVAAPPPAYADAGTCLECHADAARLWASSHHAKAMAAPDAETVRGDFGGTEFSHAGIRSRFFQREGRYVVRTDGEDGRLADFEVAWTFGWAPLQQYLIALPGGRLQPLQIAWDEPGRRWFHLLPQEKAPAGDVLHWTGRYQTANTQCLSCHTTGFDKRYDPATDTFASTWAIPNVSCQSCHGPGSRHVAWAREQAAAGRPRGAGAGIAGKAAVGSNAAALGLVVDFRAAGPRGQVEVCAACHSRRTELTERPVPGEPRLDHYLPTLLVPGMYHADGQQLDEVFVDGSYRQSLMYQRGVTCSDCHEPHSGARRAPGNALCLQCHAPEANPRFPAAAGRFDTPEHHRHAPGSAGAQCVACHMPAKTYMQIQPRPDHSMRVPRPDLTVRIGTPNACADCHADQGAPWAADALARWFPDSRHRRAPHWGEAFAAARAGRPGAAASVAAIAGDRAQPGIVRATALELLRGQPRIGDAVRVAAALDPDPEVRAAAAASLEALPGPARVSALTPLLSDPIRAVRIAAARSLATTPRAELEPGARGALDRALDEYVAAQSVSLDMPGARLNLGVLHQSLGRIPEAEREYLAALRIDPDFTPARANLARLYSLSGRNAQAERVLTEGLARLPDLGELQYSLGLLLAEEQRMTEAVRALDRAALLLPDRPRVHYNLGLTLQRLERREDARRALQRARELDPTDGQTLYALAVLEAQAQRWDEALRWAETLRALEPDNPQAAQFVDRLRQRR